MQYRVTVFHNGARVERFVEAPDAATAVMTATGTVSEPEVELLSVVLLTDTSMPAATILNAAP